MLIGPLLAAAAAAAVRTRERRGASAPASSSVTLGTYAPPCAHMQPQARVSCRGRAPRRDGRALRAGGVANPHTNVQRVSSWARGPWNPAWSSARSPTCRPRRTSRCESSILATSMRSTQRALGILHPDRPSTGAAIAWTEAWAGKTVSRCSERRSRRIPVQESTAPVSLGWSWCAQHGAGCMHPLAPVPLGLGWWS